MFHRFMHVNTFMRFPVAIYNTVFGIQLQSKKMWIMNFIALNTNILGICLKILSHIIPFEWQQI